MSTKRTSLTEFSRARRKYRPPKIRLLLIAESPPSSGGFFYFPSTIGKDHLFRETMKALDLWPQNKPMRKGVDKRSMLRSFQSMGFYLLDTCNFPVDKLPPGKRRRAVLQEIPRLVNDVINANPLQVLVVKSSIFNPVAVALRESGLWSRVLNSGPVPFPSHGNQRFYRSMLRSALRKARLLSFPRPALRENLIVHAYPIFHRNPNHSRKSPFLPQFCGNIRP
ncbi:MAG TPA: hypothetical protein VGS11_08025 [Candidatus Bathyarchaeia archaeon]|nr:hypothetical protein [Candidatus Bathyarchaeia archaeon]